MKNAMIKSLVGALILATFGCAPVKFYSDPSLKEKTGFRYYPSKPYLLVEREVSSKLIVKATVIYMPDLANPQFVKVNEGFGSRKFDIKLDNSIITSLAVATESKIPETIESIAALAAKGSEAIVDIAALKGRLEATENVTQVELYEITIENNHSVLKKVEIK